VAGSPGSAPTSTLSSAAASATVRAIGPAVSWAADTGTIPCRLTRPTVGLMPTTPHALAGQTIEPSVSVPTAIGASPAATATPDPELDPDGLRSSACGLAACPPSVLQPLVEVGERKLAHSDRLVLPRITAPAPRNRVTRKLSPDSASSSAGEPAVAGSPRTAMLSLISTGMPCSGPAGPCCWRARSLAAASASASGLTVMTAPSRGFSSAIRARQCRVSMAEVSLPAARSCCSSVRDRNGPFGAEWAGGTGAGSVMVAG
jgi:hypothetical protein